ncbi:MAG: hypothetical protein HC897_16535, partial [Thermoanaerobaculia bacterium]|nr:hypothetical protein [Thermoanaerobaculia bacterium]
MKPRLAMPILLVFLTLVLLGARSDVEKGTTGGALVAADPYGTLDGTFSVDPNGAATYEIPLEVPPGTQELAPQLALTYNSQRDNGMIGMGWALNGIENIARCNANEIPNGYTAAVSYTYRDRFCMAGMPLLAVSGEYGYDGTEYRTLRDTWTRILSHGSCGQGPCWFSALNKDGAELRFGFTTGATGSRILAGGRSDGAVRVWSQDRYTDLNGNYVAIGYNNNAVFGEYYPVRIDYSGNETTGLAPQRAVSFEYEARADRITGYTGGSPFQILKRLTAIKTWVGDTLVKNVALGYATGSTTGRSQVVSIQECSSETPTAATCLPATTFALSNPANGFSAGSSTTTGQSTSSQLGLMTMDVNGDGKTDFVDAWSSSSKLQLTTYLSTGRNLGSGSSQNTNTAAGKLGVIGMDVNGDRQGDVVMPAEVGGSLSLYTFLSTGGGFGGALQSLTGRSSAALSYLPMDVGGDGLEDVVQVIDQGGKVGFVVFPATGSGTFGPAVTSSSSFSKDNAGFFPLDANGDGRIDVVQIQKSGTVQFITYLSDGRAFDAGTATSTGRNPSQFETDAGDVNGDGLGDLLLLDQSGSSVEVVPYLSTGTTFRNVRSTTLPGGSSNLGIASATLNGDDRSDLLQRIDNGGKVRFVPYYGNGETFTAGTAFDSSLGKESLGQKLLDLDGDGKQDVLEPQDSGGKLKLSLVLNTVGQPDLLTQLTNGLGGQVLVTHLPMTDGSIYTRGTTATYPVVDIQTSMPLVANYTNTDGRGGSYRFSYRYDQGRIGYGGRGWLSFRAVKMVQDSNGRFSEVLYSQDYPGNGLVIKNGIYNQNGVSLATTDLTYEDVASSALRAKNVRQYVRTSESYSAYADNHGGARLYTLKKAYAYDSYGNVKTISDLGQPGISTDDRFTCFRYQDDVTRWRLGYVVQELLAKTAQRCDAFQASPSPTWDPTTDVNWQKRSYDERMNQTSSSVWDDSNDAWVSATATFDNYGNQLTATDPAGQTTTFEYDTTYHTFLARLTSPPNQQGTRLVDTFEFEPYLATRCARRHQRQRFRVEGRYDGPGRRRVRPGARRPLD